MVGAVVESRNTVDESKRTRPRNPKTTSRYTGIHSHKMATLNIDMALETGSWADVILGPVAPYTGHGHGTETCDSCEEADHCDCACETCIASRRELADRVCPRSYESPLQRALDRQWALANFAGPGCPFCDAMFSCSCWAERREAQEVEERRRLRAERAEIAARVARGECTCDAQSGCSEYGGYMCEVCEREESLRCRECGELQCRAGCCGGCGGCTRCRGDPCKRCNDWDCTCYDDRYEEESDYDPSDPYGDGAPEEHPGHPGYNGGYDSDF